jgi:CheY-like chemotaxis protein
VIRVLLADDQALVRGGFRLILDTEPDMEVVAEAADGNEAVARALECQPDVVLMDIRMPALDGIEATRQLLPQLAAARVVILTTFDLDDYVVDAFRAGASGFLLKRCITRTPDPSAISEECPRRAFPRAGAHVKTTIFTRRPRPVLFGVLARAGLASVTAGLILAGGTAAGAFSPMAPAAFASAASSAQEADQSAPAAPAGLAATASVGEVTLSWAASDGATSYDVYAGTTGTFQSSTKLTTVRGLSYTAAGLTNGTRYYFWVTAANGSGTSSPSSVATTPLELRGTAPGAPVRLAAVDSTGRPGALSVEVSAVPWPAVGPGSPNGSQSPTADPPASQTAGPVQASPDQQLSPVPPSQTAGPTQDQSSPGAPTGLIILLAAVAVAALTGAVALAVRHRRTRIRPGTSEAFQPGERDSRPDAMSGPRSR